MATEKSRTERIAGAVFLAATLTQLVLGAYRARISHSSMTPALVLAAIFGAIGILYFAKRREWAFAFLVRPAAVTLIAIGVMSTPTAIALPLARGSVPLFAFASAAMLATAERSWRAQAVPLSLFIVSVTALEVTLTREAQPSYSALYGWHVANASVSSTGANVEPRGFV